MSPVTRLPPHPPEPDAALPFGVTVDLAFFGCVDGDRDALEAVLAHCDRHGIFRRVALGGVGDPGGVGGDLAQELRRRGVLVLVAPGETSAGAEEGAVEWRTRIGGVSIHALVGSPGRPDRPIHRSTRVRALQRMGKRSGADILVYAHMSGPHIRCVGTRWFVNAGPVARSAGGPCLARITAGSGEPRIEIVKIAGTNSTGAPIKDRRP